MDPDLNNPSKNLIRALEAPATMVLTVCQMLLGLGLLVALILKVYMLIFTDLVCTSGVATLANLIRCTPTLQILSQMLILAAGFRAAALMFQERADKLAELLLLALVGAFLFVLADLTLANAVWNVALILATLGCAIAGLFAFLRVWPRV